MDIIGTLQQLKDEFENLQYGNDDNLDKLSRKIKLIIKQNFGENSDYLKEFSHISFYSPIFFVDNEDKEDQKSWWELGKVNVSNLIENLIEDYAFLTNAVIPTENKIIKMIENKKVFIVHGHDDSAKTEVARFIERAGLEAVILHERPNLGATIIEKIERETDVEFGIVLYTPCDAGNSQEKSNELNARARQNVVFEHGYLVAKLGRKKVVALVKGSIEKPSDIDGVVYEPMDLGGAWKYRIANEMNEVGFEVDLNKI